MTFINFIIFLAVFLLLLVILGQLTNLASNLSGLKNISPNEQEEKTANWLGKAFAIIGVIGVALLVYSYFNETDKFLPVGASHMAREFDKAFFIYSIPIVIIFFVTHFLLFWFSYKYRYKVNRVVDYFPESNKLELIWTSVPLIVVVLLGIYTTPRWLSVMAPPSEDALHIKVTGMQFKWFVAYPGADNTFGERDVIQYGELANLLGLNPNDEAGYDDKYAEEIVVPVNQEISFDLSALDVIHDFYLPHFRVKMDAVPGVPTRIKIKPDKTTAEMREITGNPEFEYEVACAELCGTGHWNMRKTLKVVSQAEYEEWLASQMTAKELYYDSLLAKDGENDNEDEEEQLQDVNPAEEEYSIDEETTASL